jgi:hypothetical protein
MDVSMAECIAVTLGKLSQVATGDHVAPWREPLSCFMPGAVSASLALLLFRVFCTSPERLRPRMKKPIRFVHASGADACTNRLGFRWPCRRRPGEVQNRPTASCAELKILISRVSHVEMPTPYRLSYGIQYRTYSEPLYMARDVKRSALNIVQEVNKNNRTTIGILNNT